MANNLQNKLITEQMWGSGAYWLFKNYWYNALPFLVERFLLFTRKYLES